METTELAEMYPSHSGLTTAQGEMLSQSQRRGRMQRMQAAVNENKLLGQSDWLCAVAVEGKSYNSC